MDMPEKIFAVPYSDKDKNRGTYGRPYCVCHDPIEYTRSDIARKEADALADLLENAIYYGIDPSDEWKNAAEQGLKLYRAQHNEKG